MLLFALTKSSCGEPYRKTKLHPKSKKEVSQICMLKDDSGCNLRNREEGNGIKGRERS